MYSIMPSWDKVLLPKRVYPVHFMLEFSPVA